MKFKPTVLTMNLKNARQELKLGQRITGEVMDGKVINRTQSDRPNDDSFDLCLSVLKEDKKCKDCIENTECPLYSLRRRV